MPILFLVVACLAMSLAGSRRQFAGYFILILGTIVTMGALITFRL